MPNYAIHNGLRVINVIVAESMDDAKSVSDMNVIETNGIPWIGWMLINNEWVPPSPYPSWILDNGEWVPPISMPDEGGEWTWDEKTLSWVEDASVTG